MHKIDYLTECLVMLWKLYLVNAIRVIRAEENCRLTHSYSIRLCAKIGIITNTTKCINYQFSVYTSSRQLGN